MSKSQESGHAKNVALFEELIAICLTFGAEYNPGPVPFAIPAMQAMLQSMKNIMERIRNAQVDNNNAINSRAILFREMKKIAGQLVNSLDAYGASKETMADAKGLLKKIRGIRVSAKPEEVLGKDPSAKKKEAISASQTGYDNLLEHFTKLVTLAHREPTYLASGMKTSKAALTESGLVYADANKQVVDTRSVLGAGRIDRDALMYIADTGALAVAGDVKKYVKSVFGLSSAQYKQLSKLRFRTIPK